MGLLWQPGKKWWWSKQGVVQGKDHWGQGCGLEELVSCWIRLRRRGRLSIMPWLQTGMTKDGWRHCSLRILGRFWGVDSDVAVSNRHEEVVVFSSAVKSCRWHWFRSLWTVGGPHAASKKATWVVLFLKDRYFFNTQFIYPNSSMFTNLK